MNPISRILAALRRKSELQEELQSHLNLAIADRVARGESPETARREAKYYKITPLGKQQLASDYQRWGQMVSAIESIMAGVTKPAATEGGQA